jgi:hypothetical protein
MGNIFEDRSANCSRRQLACHWRRHIEKFRKEISCSIFSKFGGVTRRWEWGKTGGGAGGTLAVDDVVGTDPVPESRGTETLAGGAAANLSTWLASKRNEHSRESKRPSDKMPGGDMVGALPGVTEDWRSMGWFKANRVTPPGHEMGSPWVGWNRFLDKEKNVANTQNWGEQ